MQLCSTHRDLAARRRATWPPGDSNLPATTTVDNLVDGDTLDVSIDLGFQVTRHQRLRLASIDAPPIKTAAGRRTRTFLHKHLTAARTGG